MIVVDSDLRAESGKLIGRVTQTHPVLPRPKAGDGPRKVDLEENVGSRSVSTSGSQGSALVLVASIDLCADERDLDP